MDALKAALWFAQQGYGVFPVWGVTEQGTCLCPDGVNCTNGAGKHPATKHGFKDHTTDPGAITKFLSNPGTPNYGLVPPPRVGVIDVDKEDVLRWDELQATLGELPPTLTTVTANGFHYHFDWGDDPVPSNLHGLIVRGTESGYVVGPGSHHKSGITYNLLRETTTLAALPEKWKVETKKPTNGGVVSLTVGGIQPESVGEGHRHAYLRDRARTMRGAGMSDTDIFEQLLKLNARFPEPKLDEEVRRAMGDLSQFTPDPLPITLNVPTTQELSSQQRLDAQRAAIQTLDQLPFGKPPEPLVLGTFIAPEGMTVLYANGGTGKGLLALWMMRFVLYGNDKRIVVLDYEGHRWEWGNRARAIGWKQDELERVLYIDPYDPVWKNGHTLAGIAPELRPIGQDLDVCLYVIDSYAMASSAESELGGVKAAKEFFQGGASLGVPGLVLAHTSADKEERFPAKPFGSVFIHNLARETWAGAQVGAEQQPQPPAGKLMVTGSSIQVELRNKKRSVGGRTLAAQTFDIEFRPDESIFITHDQNFAKPVHELILAVLATTTGSMTLKQLCAAIKEDTGREVPEISVYRALARGIEGVDEDASRRPKTYSLEAS